MHKADERVEVIVFKLSFKYNMITSFKYRISIKYCARFNEYQLKSNRQKQQYGILRIVEEESVTWTVCIS